jgi:Flp pilus assembly protein TadG
MQHRLLRRLASSRDGSVMLETALMITILLMLMFGIVDLGRVLYTQNDLVSAAREGARYGATDANFRTTGLADTIAVQDTTRAHFNTMGGTAMTRAMVAVTEQGAGITSIRVVVSYPFTWITPIPRLLKWTTAGGTMTSTLHAQAEYRYEQ